MDFRFRQETANAGSTCQTSASHVQEPVMRPLKGHDGDPFRRDIRVYGDGGWMLRGGRIVHPTS